MKYLLIVSHGTMAPGVKSVLEMLLGARDNVLAYSMEDGVSADDFVAGLKKTIEPVTPDDEVVVLGDIIGGSPLTNTLNTITEKGLLPHTIAFGGVNLPMAISALMAIEDGLDNDALRAQLLSESKEAIKEVELQVAEEDEDDL
jgi:PTS system N-acetylgalactosamine-specific IIA component